MIEKKEFNDLILYGAGKRGKMMAELLMMCNIPPKAIFDSSQKIVGKSIMGMKVRPPQDLIIYRDCQWCITISSDRDIALVREQLKEKGYKTHLEVIYTELMLDSCLKGRMFRYKDTIHSTIRKSRSYLFDCSNGLVLGGIEARTVILCSGLVNRGVDDVYIVSDSNKPEIKLPKNLKPHIIRSIINKAGVTIAEIIQDCIDIIIQNLPCTIVTNQLDYFLLAAYLVRYHFSDDVKIISNVAGLTERIISEYAFYGVTSDLYVAVSKDIRQALVEKGIPSKMIDVVYTPFYCKEKLIRTYSDEDAPLIIGYAGRMDGLSNSQKRLDLVLEIIRLMHKRGIDFTFNLAGDGCVREQIQSTIKQMGLDDRVNFLGVIPKTEIIDFWVGQDIAINMADYEGRSISVVEAMGAGAVPVVTDTSGVRDDILDGDNGFIVPIGDYIAAVDRIEYLSNNKKLLIVMGMKAHDEVLPKSSIENYVKYWMDILEIFEVSNNAEYGI